MNILWLILCEFIKADMQVIQKYSINSNYHGFSSPTYSAQNVPTPNFILHGLREKDILHLYEGKHSK